MIYGSTEDALRYTFFRGRVAMAAILRGLGVTRGDEVAIQAFTCLAVPEGVIASGARPVYVDVTRRGVTMDPASLEQRLTPRIRAIVVQHTYGMPTEMDAVTAIAARHRVPVIEDCAHAVGSMWAGVEVGQFGIGAFFSHEASKPVFAGLGGSTLLNDSALADAVGRAYGEYREPPLATQVQLLAMYHAHGLLYRPATYWALRRTFRAFVRLGLVKGNYNKVAADAAPSTEFTLSMGRLQRGVLRRELRSLGDTVAHRRQVFDALRDLPLRAGLSHVSRPAAAAPVFARVPFFAEDKAALVAEAARARVELADFYSSPVHGLEGNALRQVGYEPGTCPNAEWASAHAVSLPSNRHMHGAALRRAQAFLRGAA